MKKKSNNISQLIKKIRELKKSKVAEIIEKRKRGFSAMKNKSNNHLFKELCFCILTANYSAEGGIRIQKAMGDNFLKMSEKQLALKLKSLGYRFPNTRAHYISLARKHKNKLKVVLSSDNPREWLVKNIKGLGYKEASHFLRNVGYFNYAIIDFHILDLLERFGFVKKPKTMSKKVYLKIEKKLAKICKVLNISQGELDLYLWYLETGKVLK